MSEVKLTESEKKKIMLKSIQVDLHEYLFIEIEQILTDRITKTKAKQRADILASLPKEKNLICSDNRNDEIKRTGFNECLAEVRKAVANERD